MNTPVRTLEDKKILFISVKFFNYEDIIKTQLENLGAEVDWFDERPSNTVFTKAMIRVNKKLISTSINDYFKKVIEEIIHKKYDYFILFKGEATPKFFIEFLKKNNPGIKLVFYTWDSFANNNNGLEIMDLFDRKFTFDPQDAKKYNIGFRPLFFAQNYAKLYEDKKAFKYDLAFIGTAHSDRYLITEKIRDWCVKNGIRLFTFYFSPSKILFKFKKITTKEFKLFDENKIAYNCLGHQEIINIYAKAKVVLDINHPGQKGLTMRTFESLGAGRKLITTNPEIRKYPFYNQDNICVIDRKNIVLNTNFFKTEFIPLEKSLLESMSLKGMLEEILGLTENHYWENV